MFLCERSLSMELGEAGFAAEAYPPTLQVDFVEPTPGKRIRRVWRTWSKVSLRFSKLPFSRNLTRVPARFITSPRTSRRPFCC